MYTPTDENFFYCLSHEKQIEIKQKYATACLKSDNESMKIVSLYEDFYGKDVLINDNPYMKFIV